MVISATTFIAMLIIMFYLNVTLSVVFIVCIVLIFLIQYVAMMGKKAQVLVKGFYDTLEEINSSSIEYVKGMPTVKIFGKDIFSFKKFLTSIIEYKNLSLKYTNEFQNGFSFFKIISFSTLSVLVPIGVYLYFNGHATKEFIFSFLFFVILTPAISSPLARLLFFTATLRDFNEGVDRIDKILQSSPMLESSNPKIPTSYEVEFSNVSFSYHDNSDYALKNVSFKSFGTTALVGPSGGGKSTILNLIARFYDVKDGKISIGGVNILDIPSQKLMEMVSFVFQDSFLFFDSVLENVRIARPNASVEEVRQACRLAQCDEFIQRLPKGYDTLIGEGGVYLSGGEEQRVCLARALLKDTPILILDEASSFSDAHNESQIQKALKEVSKNKVVFIIAHRLYLVKDADQILVFEDGGIKERGKHSDLMNENGLYAKMYTASLEVANYYFKNREV